MLLANRKVAEDFGVMRFRCFGSFDEASQLLRGQSQSIFAFMLRAAAESNRAHSR